MWLGTKFNDLKIRLCLPFHLLNYLYIRERKTCPLSNTEPAAIPLTIHQHHAVSPWPRPRPTTNPATVGDRTKPPPAVSFVFCLISFCPWWTNWEMGMVGIEGRTRGSFCCQSKSCLLKFISLRFLVLCCLCSTWFGLITPPGLGSHSLKRFRNFPIAMRYYHLFTFSFCCFNYQLSCRCFRIRMLDNVFGKMFIQKLI